MIYSVNNHTCSNFSKFIYAYPWCYAYQKTVVQDQKMLNITKARHGNNHYNANLNHGSHSGMHPLAKFENIKSFFQVRPLLCWRSDLSFFSLRGFFQNFFVACHILWLARCNNKRIGFVGLDGNLMHASVAIYARMYKASYASREILPGLKHYPYTFATHAKCHHGNQKEKGSKRMLLPRTKKQSGIPTKLVCNAKKKHNMLLRRSSHSLLRWLTQACNVENAHPLGYEAGVKKSHQHQNVIRNIKANLPRNASNFKTYVLQSKIAFMTSRYNALLYNGVNIGFFSNPVKPYLRSFNTFYRVFKTGCEAARHGVYEHNYGYTPSYDLKIYETYRTSDPYLNVFYARGLSFGEAGAKKTRHTHLLASRTRLTSENKNRAFKAFKHACRLKWYLGLRHLSFKRSHFKAKVNVTALKKSMALMAKRTAAFKTKRCVKGPMKKACMVFKTLTFLKKKQTFNKASNPHLRQADVLFFTNPDRHQTLVRQARKYRCPTIGLVSGAKTQQTSTWDKHNSQRPSVDIALLGNGDNSFFVFMIFRLLLNLLHQGGCRIRP